jgi:nanoRNase/pAp phosphatase (c-di-AMP/oligoRNAs hydrolase)
MTFIVFYHYPCPDGEMAKSIWNLKNTNSIYYQWNHKYTEKNYNLVNKHKNEILVFLDICPDQKLLSDDNKYIIIDHHKNAIEQLQKANNITSLCSDKASGCQLTWQYLFKNKNYPLSVYHIGNYDIWNFENKNTELFCAGYNPNNKNNFNYSTILTLTEEKYNNILKIGQVKIDEYKKQTQICLKKVNVNIEIINCKNILIVTLICKNPKIYKYLLETVQEQYNGCNVLRIQCCKSEPIRYSLRSIDGITTVDDIARYYGGNGHPFAAGYKINKK